MGTLSLHHTRSAALDSPPQLVSPSSSTYSSRPSPPADLVSWASSSNGPISPPMSSYERNTRVSVPDHGKKGAEDVEGRPGSAQSQPSQQLPSLSSLFGPPSSMVPLHSPLSDRPSTYHATSPLDPPRVSPAYSDRSYASSYFPPTTPLSTTQPRALHGPRYDTERHSSLYPLSASYAGPESPRSREADYHRHDRRYDGHATPRWPAPQDRSRFESPVDKSMGQFRPPQERYPFQFSAGKEMAVSYRDPAPQSSNGLGHHSAASSHAASSESVIATDALGPKIWTGTHFLPRFIRAAEVPGEGMCYFYDDGTHCKTVIDGEAVNAHWGVTKAGKPRKRLAIACMTCREKKIKCDPDFPRCVQCEKFGRVCKFKNAPRGGHNASPSTPPAETATADSRRLGASSSENEIRGPVSDSRSVSPRTHIRLPSPEPPATHKRLRLGFDTHVSVTRTEHSSGAPAVEPLTKPNLSWQPRPLIELPRIHDDVLHRPWQSDPYVSA